MGSRPAARRPAALPLPARGHLRPHHLPAARTLAAGPAPALRRGAQRVPAARDLDVRSALPALLLARAGGPRADGRRVLRAPRGQRALLRSAPRLHGRLLPGSAARDSRAAGRVGPLARLGAAAVPAGHGLLRLQPLRRLAGGDGRAGAAAAVARPAAGRGRDAGAGRDDEVVSGAADPAVPGAQPGDGHRAACRLARAPRGAPARRARAGAGRRGGDPRDPRRHVLRRRRLGGGDAGLHDPGGPGAQPALARRGAARALALGPGLDVALRDRLARAVPAAGAAGGRRWRCSRCAAGRRCCSAA